MGQVRRIDASRTQRRALKLIFKGKRLMGLRKTKRFSQALKDIKKP
jgi:hypothetical protein